MHQKTYNISPQICGAEDHPNLIKVKKSRMLTLTKNTNNKVSYDKTSKKNMRCNGKCDKLEKHHQIQQHKLRSTL